MYASKEVCLSFRFSGAQAPGSSKRGLWLPLTPLPPFWLRAAYQSPTHIRAFFCVGHGQTSMSKAATAVAAAVAELGGARRRAPSSWDNSVPVRNIALNYELAAARGRRNASQ